MLQLRLGTVVLTVSFFLTFVLLACSYCCHTGSRANELRRRSGVIVVYSGGPLSYFGCYRGDRSRCVGSGQGSSHRLALQEPGEPADADAFVMHFVGAVMPVHACIVGVFKIRPTFFVSSLGRTEKFHFSSGRSRRIDPLFFSFFV